MPVPRCINYQITCAQESFILPAAAHSSIPHRLFINALPSRSIDYMSEYKNKHTGANALPALLQKMGIEAIVVLLLSLSGAGLVAGDWNLLSYITSKEEDGNNVKSPSSLDFSLKNYCEAWRMNVELHNIRGFEVVPSECAGYVGAYMTSKQYKVDVQLAAEECASFLTDNFQLSSDGKDAWVFDIDDVLLSTVPYFKFHNFGGDKIDKNSLEAWMREATAPAIDHILKLYRQIKHRGLKIFIMSSRAEYLREATIENLISVGYHGWTDLILRSEEEEKICAEEYEATQRGKLVHEGYRLWGIVGSQWSSLGGYTTARRIFKLPNSMYYKY